ncbi:oocyte zinc finger protein XlCOF28-like [Pieris brassicae]|uniref:Uncharacterized protein n=1 Tax=Pieris brassicae TaxID=7116 RepID=A0A9P0XFM1_PIEBR|nr:oocyte zinc finger protein XlCOF28-like [Pieris brassicae]CAH4034476.1 unnamed protein product [Pieris brassicae]
MNTNSLCRCCLARPPDKELKSSYTCFGKHEIYADMLKDCFEIHLPIDISGVDGGICEICITRLRDSFDFKHQVLRCQKEFQLAIKDIKKEEMTNVKEEVIDDGDSYFFDMTTALPDIDSEDKLAEIFGLKDIKRKRRRKRLTEDDDCDDLPLKIFSTKNADISDNAKHSYNVNKILKYSNCTPFFNKTLSGIVCASCKTTCTNINELRTHVQDNHADTQHTDKRLDKSNISIKIDISDLHCKLCLKRVQNIPTLKKHLTSEHNEKFFPDIYDYIFEFKLTDGDILNCALCNSTFETFKMLLQHMNGHYRNYICDECDMGFINRHRLKNHKRTHEIGDFKCTYCDKVFTTLVRRKCHEKYTHNTSARYTTNCPHCDKTFNSYYQRNRHMYDEHNISAATYKCNVCDKSFILKSKLTSHIKKVHLMERNHKCPLCEQGFFIKQSLDEHMVRHNGERVFSCTVCHKAYARKKTLREHMRIHNNDRRFKCGLCGLAFVQKCSMKSHMLSNHGISLMEFENAAKAISVKAN